MLFCFARGSFRRQRAVDVRAVTRAAQRGDFGGVPELARNICQGAKLRAGSGLRQQQQKNDVDGLAINSVKRDGFFEVEEHSKRLLDLMKSRVWYRYAVAHARRSEILALVQSGEDAVSGYAEPRPGLAGNFPQKFLLVRCGKLRHDVACRKEIGDFHFVRPLHWRMIESGDCMGRDQSSARSR